jgi:hypothetical protein
VGVKSRRLARDNAYSSSDPRILMRKCCDRFRSVALIGSYRSSPCVAPGRAPVPKPSSWPGLSARDIRTSKTSSRSRLQHIIEILQRLAAPPTVKQHMAAIRMLFSWLTEKGVLAMDPAREVKTERFSRTEGKTPAFVEGEVQSVIETSDFWSTTLQSGGGYSVTPRALLGVLAYTFARIGAVCEFLLIQKKFVAAPNKWQLVNPLAPRRYGSGVQVLVADPQDPQERFYAEAGQCIRRYLTKH